jgi:hypothetical protein
MQYSAPTYQPRLSVLSRCLIAACCSMLGACGGGGGGASSEPEKPLSAELPSLTTAAATAASGADSAASAASAPEATAQVAAAIEPVAGIAVPVADAAATAASAAASEAAGSTSKIAATATKVDGAAAVIATSATKIATPAPAPAAVAVAPAAAAIKTGTVVVATAPTPAVAPSPAPAAVTSTKVPTAPAVLVIPTLTAVTTPVANIQTPTSTASPAPSIPSAAVVAEPLAYPPPSTPGLRSTSLLLNVRAAPDEWSAAKALVKADVNWSNWVSYKKDVVATWFAKTRDRADLIAGYPNDFVNPTTGVAVNWTIDMPEPATGSTAAQIAYKNAWTAITRGKNISYALDAARLFQLTGETKYAELAAAQLDFYAANYMKWPLRTAVGNARMMSQSLDEANRVLEMIETAHALQSYASAGQKAKWRDGLFYPIAANLQTYSYGPLNNINLWCATATTAIGLEYGNQVWIDAGTTGPKGVSAVMAQGVTKDGIWFEGSFAYNNYVLVALGRLFDAAASAGRHDLVTIYAADVQKMLMAPAVYRFDDGTLPTPSDTREPVPPIDAFTHGALYRHVPTTFGLQYAAGIRNWDTLRDPPPKTAAAPSLPAPQSNFSPDIRMASIRGGDWQVFVHFGQKTLNHAQEEALTYELVNGKTSISRDAGASTSYSSAQQNEYFAKGVGNNVPLIDGMGQEQWALGEVKGFDPIAGTLDVLHPSYRSDISARRSYKVGTAGFSETTRISTKTANSPARRLGVMFNTSCNVQISDPRAGVASNSAAPLGSPGFKHWTGVLKQQAQATWTAKLACAGGKNYELTMAGPGSHTVYRATAPSTPLPATRNALYVETSGTDASFTTSIKAIP